MHVNTITHPYALLHKIIPHGAQHLWDDKSLFRRANDTCLSRIGLYWLSQSSVGANTRLLLHRLNNNGDVLLAINKSQILTDDIHIDDHIKSSIVMESCMVRDTILDIDMHQSLNFLNCCMLYILILFVNMTGVHALGLPNWFSRHFLVLNNVLTYHEYIIYIYIIIYIITLISIILSSVAVVPGPWWSYVIICDNDHMDMVYTHHYCPQC